MPTSKDPAPTEAPAAPASEFTREQDKGGTDPVSPPVEPAKAEPVDIAANEPYPTGGGHAEQGVPHNTPPADEAK